MSMKMSSTKRGNVYRLAFWILIRRLSIRDVLINYPYPNTLKILKVKGSDLKDAMDILEVACSIEELTDDDTEYILNESIDSYLTRKCLCK